MSTHTQYQHALRANASPRDIMMSLNDWRRRLMPCARCSTVSRAPHAWLTPTPTPILRATAPCGTHFVRAVIALCRVAGNSGSVHCKRAYFLPNPVKHTSGCVQAAKRCSWAGTRECIVLRVQRAVNTLRWQPDNTGTATRTASLRFASTAYGVHSVLRRTCAHVPSNNSMPSVSAVPAASVANIHIACGFVDPSLAIFIAIERTQESTRRKVA